MMHYDDIKAEFEKFTTITYTGLGFCYAEDDTFFYLIDGCREVIKVGYKMTFDRWENSVDYLLAFPTSEIIMEATKYFLSSKQINQAIVVKL